MLALGTVVFLFAASALRIPDVDGPFIRDLGSGIGSGDLVAELLVAPDHSVQGCKVLSRIPEAEARRVCDQARRMKVKTIAADQDGKPIYGFVMVARIAVVDVGGGRKPLWRYPPDIEVTVRDSLGKTGRKDVFVTVLVDETGQVNRCESESTGDSDLSAVACQQATQVRFPVVNDSSGTAIRYARLLNVEFIDQHDQGATR